MVSKAGDALEVRRQNGDVATNTVAAQIRRMQSEFQVAMPRGMEADQLVRDALTAIRMTPKLAECEVQSVLGALMTCAQLGLRVGVLGQAWPIPFWDKNARMHKAQLIIGYQGYSELAHRSPKVMSFIPRVVYANDEFDVDYGVQGTLVHKPARGVRGDAIGFHSIARYDNGGYDFLFMSAEEMAEHRDKFAMQKKNGVITGPWVDHFASMGQKTTQRLLAKFIPKSPELAIARVVDGGLRIDLNPRTPAEEVTTLEHELIDGVEVELPAPPTNLDEPMSEPQKKRLMAMCTEAGLDREQRLFYAAEVLGRPVETFSTFKSWEASKVMDAVQRYVEQNAGPKP